MNKKYRLVKYSGQVFTPGHIVEQMLDFSQYTTTNILQKHFIDNSCGDGAFLCAAVARYCDEFLASSANKDELKKELEHYFHGIELDDVAYKNCIFNLNETAELFGLLDVAWDIKHQDALTVSEYNGKMDFVIGNPPYVRVHNLEEKYSHVKTFIFTKGGMTDLYLAFFELGFGMAKKKTGKLCYITPSSWLNSLAATNMRNYIFHEKKLAGLIDLEHYQAFEGATTYTLISLFDNLHTGSTFDYFVYQKEKQDKKWIDTLAYVDISIGGYFYVSERSELNLVKTIKESVLPKYTKVKNGFATLADKVFIGNNVPFDNFTIPIIKASTGKWTKGFFPYNKLGKPFSKDTIFNELEVASYLNANKDALLKKSKEEDKPDWYLYGRTQALKDVYTNKIAINTIIKDINSIKLNRVPAGSGLYSGLYILTKAPFEVIESIVKSDDFMDYIKTLKKYKSGGYYTFNSKDLEQYLNYKLSKHEHSAHFIPTNQQGVSQGCLKFI